MVTRHEERIKKENKMLRNIIIGIIVLFIVITLIVFPSVQSSSFTYKGVKFSTVKFCDSGPPCLILFNTSLPVRSNGTDYLVSSVAQSTNSYIFYLRNDPRKLNVSFNGSPVYNSNIVLKYEAPFVCNDSALAGANFNLLYQTLGANVIKDQNATCDPFNRYTYIDFLPGNETKIVQFGPACYNIYIKGCEVLQGTEKYMIETFVKVNDELYNQSY